MKISLRFLLFFLISLNSKVKSQQYNIFPLVDSANWRMYYGCGDAFLCSEDLLYDYSIQGDTSIFGQVYKKLFISGTKLYIHHFGSPNCCLIYPSNGYVGAIRQDTISRKVFVFEPNFNSDSLLYDFTLDVGDTLKSSLLSNIFLCDSSDLIVTEIDSVLIGSTYHKKWIFNCYLEYIEGIGSTIDPFGVYNRENGINLICFKYNDTPVYLTGANSWTCDIPLKVDNPLNRSSTISCNNFVTDLLKIHFDHNNFKTDKYVISISNNLGEIVFRKKHTDTLSELQLQLDWLASGMYFLKIESFDSPDFFLSKLIKK